MPWAVFWGKQNFNLPVTVAVRAPVQTVSPPLLLPSTSFSLEIVLVMKVVSFSGRDGLPVTLRHPSFPSGSYPWPKLVELSNLGRLSEPTLVILERFKMLNRMSGKDLKMWRITWKTYAIGLRQTILKTLNVALRELESRCTRFLKILSSENLFVLGNFSHTSCLPGF